MEQPYLSHRLPSAPERLRPEASVPGGRSSAGRRPAAVDFLWFVFKLGIPGSILGPRGLIHSRDSTPRHRRDTDDMNDAAERSESGNRNIYYWTFSRGEKNTGSCTKERVIPIQENAA